MSLFAKTCCAAVALFAVAATEASAAVPHMVMPGETLWSIAEANNFTTHTVAAYNGLSDDAQVYVGETIQIPTETEGAAAVASSGTTSTTSSTTSRTKSGMWILSPPGRSVQASCRVMAIALWRVTG